MVPEYTPRMAQTKKVKRKPVAKKPAKVWQGPVPGDSDYGVCYSEWELAHATSPEAWGEACRRPARWQVKELGTGGHASAIGRPKPALASVPPTATRTTIGVWLSKLLGI